MAFIDEKLVIPGLEEKPSLGQDTTREEEVRNAVSRQDWDALRALSLLPGGFAEARVEAWQFLLDALPAPGSVKREAVVSSIGDLEPHKDERQVGLDTDRSFVLYPIEGESITKSKDDLKAQLHHIIVHVLRKRPKLSYFQGYHDILSVLMLTANERQEHNRDMTDEELTTQLNLMAEKLSLHRLRDSMGPGLEPLVGLLRLVKQLLRAVDPEYARQLSSSSPLPYFTLSNLLTYFSHDVPTLPLVQHIFDYLLSRPPIAVVYLATVLLLVRKSEVQQLYEAGDEGMLHAILTNVPELVDDLPASLPSAPLSPKPEAPYPSDLITEAPLSSDLTESWHEATAQSPSSNPDLSLSQTWTAASTTSSQSWTAAESTMADSIPSPGASPRLAPLPLAPAAGPLSGTDDSSTLNVDSILDFPPLEQNSRPASPDEKHLISASMVEVERPTKKGPLSLVSLLKQADDLFFQYPPKTLHTSQIMGPQSVIFTWCERPIRATKPSSTKVEPLSPVQPNLAAEFAHRLDKTEKAKVSAPSSGSSWTAYQTNDPISDDMAESMVRHPELVVLSYKDEDELEVEREAEEAREERRKAAEERAAKRRQAKGHEAGILGAIGGPKTSVIVVGGMIVVVALGVVIAVYGKNGEWKKWIGRSWIGRGSL